MDNCQTYAVEMHRVLENRGHGVSRVLGRDVKLKAYRATESASRHGNLHGLAHRELVDKTGRKKILGGRGATHDLEEDRNGRRCEALAIYVNLALDGILCSMSKQLIILLKKVYLPLQQRG